MSPDASSTAEIIARLNETLADRYRLERRLGEGGMATVYLAEDLRHHRKVAVKVLRAELSAILGAERFLHEITTTANLQHPHILSLFDSGEAAGMVFYVMPYVEGESLRDRLRRSHQLPVEEAVRIAREVADALDYAHRHGVIHRDIKPENILLHDGRVQVADFGIALAVSRSDGGTRMTETGMSLGTPHYMSPEQAMGEREISAASDIYALGCVTYEMLIGEPPFTGPTAQSIVARVMTEEPRSLTLQRKTVPPEVEAAVLTALEKLPADRFASAAEFGEALSGARALAGRRGATAALARAPEALWRRVAIGLGTAGVLATAVAAWGWLRPTAPPPFPSRLAIPVPGLGGSGGPALQRQLALTRDGTTLVYVVVSADGVNRMLRHPLDASEGTVIAGSDGLAGPAVSPDGQWLLGTQWSLGPFRLPMSGGTRTPLPSAIQTTAYSDWDAEGRLWIDGEQPRQTGVARLGQGDSVVYPLGDASRDLEVQQILPGTGRALAVRKSGTAVSGTVAVVDLRNGSSRVVLDLGQPILEARYTAGCLVLVQLDGTLLAVPFDPKRSRTLGDPVTIATGVSVTGTGFGQIAVAGNGTIAYIPEEPRSLVFVQRDGNSREPVAARHSYHAPMFSPDGRRVATDFITAEGRDTWVLSLDQGTLTRATFQRDGHDATWTPDGRYLTYSSARGNALGLFRTRPGSAVDAESLFVSPGLAYTGVWLPDGSGLVTVATGLKGSSGNDIGLLEGQGRGPLIPLVASQFEESYPAVSPDGRWLAFVSNQSGRQEVYVRPLHGDGDQVQVSLAGATEPLWSRNGRELFYRSTEAESQLVAAAVRTTPGFEVVDRRPLFPMHDIVGTNPHTNYDVSPDGRTFAMVRRSPASRIVVIQNLPGLVERLRGAGTAAR